MTPIEQRQFWTSVHRYGGLGAMLFLAIAAATGVLLSFTVPLDAALNRDLFLREDTAPLVPATAVARFVAAHPAVIVTSFPVHVAAGSTVPVGVASRPGAAPLTADEVFLDRADGHVRGMRRSGPGWDRRHLMQGVFAFHYTLLAGRWGRWLMGVAALAWFVGNLVGVYITLPIKGAFWKQWKRTWQVRAGSSLPRLLFDLHRASGLWLSIGATLLALTSVCMNFFDEAFVPVVSSLSPARASLFDRPAPSTTPTAPRIDAPAALRLASTEARHRGWAWQPAKVAYLPAFGIYRVLFTDDGVENYHRLGPVSLYLSGADGRIAETDDPYTDSLGQRLSRSLYPIHTGKVAGRVGIAVDILLGLATLEMVGSGAYLWLKRRRGRVQQRRARRARARGQR